MRWKPSLAPAFAAVSAFLAACVGNPEAAEPTFLAAAIEGDHRAEYAGSGSFQVSRPGTAGPVRFTLYSVGSGESAGEGFWFHSTRTPVPGERGLGALDAASDRAAYWRDEGNVRRIYAAEAGTLRLDQVTSRRVAGSFQLRARLTYVCSIEPVYPKPILNCEAVSESARVEIAGSFEAGPLGGDTPGLAPFPS